MTRGRRRNGRTSSAGTENNNNTYLHTILGIKGTNDDVHRHVKWLSAVRAYRSFWIFNQKWIIEKIKPPTEMASTTTSVKQISLPFLVSSFCNRYCVKWKRRKAKQRKKKEQCSNCRSTSLWNVIFILYSFFFFFILFAVKRSSLKSFFFLNWTAGKRRDSRLSLSSSRPKRQRHIEDTDFTRFNDSFIRVCRRFCTSPRLSSSVAFVSINSRAGIVKRGL